MNNEQWAYLAGVLDGEGCLTIRRHKRQYQGYLILANNSVKLLEFAQTCMGGKLYCLRGTPGHQLHVHGATLARALRALLPYLIVKQEEAVLLLAFLDRPARTQWQLSEADIQELEAYCLSLSALKGEKRKGRPRREDSKLN